MSLMSIQPFQYRPVQSSVNRQSLAAHRSSPVTVRFGGVGDAVSSFISLIDRNRAAELVASDGLGMLVPRTAVAAGFRGGDDARETLIREGAGLFCVALLAGLSNQMMIHVLGNRVGVYNPHGTPVKAWIGAKNLRAYSHLYEEVLKNSNHGSVGEVRQAFVQKILSGLESGDRQLSVDSRLAALDALKQSHPALADKVLGQMAQDLQNGAEKKPDYAALFKSGRRDILRQTLLDNGWGRLSPEGIRELTGYFAQKSSGEIGAIGTVPVDALAWSQVNEFEKNVSPAARQSAFLKTRLQLSLKNLKDETPSFIRTVDQLALDHGLTSVVHLKSNGGTGEALLSGQSRQTVLKEIKAFLEHYVDRAGYEVRQSFKGKDAAWALQRELLSHKLFASSGTGLKRLIPQVEDGLVTAMLKAKTGYSLVPIAIAIIANGISTFMNNYITQRKYKGRVFFPGEETYLSRTQPQVQAPGVGHGPSMAMAMGGRLA